jgi:hypothetical protein
MCSVATGGNNDPSFCHCVCSGASLRDDDYQYMELEAVDRESEAPLFRSGNASGLWPLFVQGHLLESEDEVECNYQGLREGSRVTRGPTWHRNNDGTSPVHRGEGSENGGKAAER